MLIASTAMQDTRFSQSIIFICAHSDEGAMGLIVNKLMGGMKFSDILDLKPGQENTKFPVHFGGPVEGSRGFVLHTDDYFADDSSLQVNDRYAMSSTLDVVEAIFQGQGPELALLALGYSGWGPGQLEDEIAQNAWLICDGSDDLIFMRGDESKWSAALNTLGIDPLTLSSDAGRA